jgi:hypothetical protein
MVRAPWNTIEVTAQQTHLMDAHPDSK